MPTRNEQINEVITTMLKENNVEDTPHIRLIALEAVRDAWREDPDSSLEKTFYMLALTNEISAARIKVMFENVKI